jgi:hypothetical protein
LTAVDATGIECLDREACLELPSVNPAGAAWRNLISALKAAHREPNGP